jgi:hypothetical protein
MKLIICKQIEIVFAVSSERRRLPSSQTNSRSYKQKLKYWIFLSLSDLARAVIGQVGADVLVEEGSGFLYRLIHALTVIEFSDQ